MIRFSNSAGLSRSILLCRASCFSFPSVENILDRINLRGGTCIIKRPAFTSLVASFASAELCARSPSLIHVVEFFRQSSNMSSKYFQKLQEIHEQRLLSEQKMIKIHQYVWFLWNPDLQLNLGQYTWTHLNKKYTSLRLQKNKLILSISCRLVNFSFHPRRSML